jgi:ABC-type multidrug transport system permease subunit
MSASVNMLLAFLGGGFVPLSLYPAFLRTLAYALPNGAAQAGIFQTLESPGNLQDIFWRVAAVWAWAFVLISAAISMQNRRMHS